MSEQAAPSKRSTAHVLRNGVALAMALFEVFMLAEILWYCLHDGEQTLHGAVGDYLRELRERVERDTAIDETLDMIRDLPETDDER